MASPDAPCPLTTVSKPPSCRPRQRARRACIGCRTRKVRCDVTVKGLPCTNCQLDCTDCVIKQRAPRPTRRLVAAYQETRQNFFRSRVSPTPEDHELELLDETGGFAAATQSPPDEPAEASDNLLSRKPSYSTKGVIHDQSTPRLTLPKTDGDSQQAPFSLEPPRMERELLCQPDIDPECDRHEETMLFYTAYPFLAIDNLAAMCPQDLAFLQAKGALHVPTKSLLDEFVRQYFLQVHPFYPMMDEGDFWCVYRQDAQARSASMVPLMVFQAMLFASSNFVSEAVIASLGYENARSARAALYHNAKLLFDFSAEESPVAITQAALLMSLWSPPEPKPMHPNEMWLHIAIQHARHVNAHQAWEASTGPILDDNLDPRQEPHMLRRIWWCCLIRDRLMALGLRRSLQIRRRYPTVYFSDFEHEIGRSEVHNNETKRVLVLMFLRLIHLGNIVVDLLVALSPLDNPTKSEHQSLDIPIKCRKDLRTWYERTQKEMSAWLTSDRDREHAVTIHKSILFIFYNSARSATLRQEILLSCYPLEEPGIEALTNYEMSQELQDAVISTVGCLSELSQLGLSRYLPLSIIAYITVPLFFHILDAKVLYPQRNNEIRYKVRDCRLRVLIETLKEHRTRYDGIEWISYTLRHTVNLAVINLASMPKGLFGSWADLLTQQPSFCLRLALMVDLSISRVKIPEDRDFPIILRASLRSRSSLLGQSLSMNSSNRALDFQDLDFERVVPRSEPKLMTKHTKHASHLKEACLGDCSIEEVPGQVGEANGAKSHVYENGGTLAPMLTTINAQMDKPLMDTGEQSRPEDEIMSHSVTDPFDLPSPDGLIIERFELETLMESELERYMDTVSTGPD